MNRLSGALLGTSFLLFFTACELNKNTPLAKEAVYQKNTPANPLSPPIHVGSDSFAYDETMSVPPMPAGLNGAGFMPNEDHNTPHINGWVDTAIDKFSTFAADVDTGSYTFARATLNNGAKPNPKDIRVEEFINYFPFDYPKPESETFNVTMDMGPSQISDDVKYLRVGVVGKTLETKEHLKSNIVFLVDVSGSMQGSDRLDLAKKSMEALLNNLDPKDTIAIVTYASDTRVLLPATFAEERSKILDVIYSLGANGSTAMGNGIELAYDEALKNVSPQTNSRVIILSDGDANVGETSPEAILETIKEKVQEGVFLTTVGFGLGNYQDEMMETLADNGNGNYYYIDSFKEAKRVFEGETNGMLDAIAKDLKIQVEFNPNTVAEYRLVGYENRDVRDEDFTNPDVDAGEIGAGHTVTAIYEVKLKEEHDENDEIAKVRLRYQDLSSDSKEEVEKIYTRLNNFDTPDLLPKSFQMASAIAIFAELLRESPYIRDYSINNFYTWSQEFFDKENPFEAEFLTLVEQAKKLWP